MQFRPLTDNDLEQLLDVQQEAAVAGLANIFPQDKYPFRRDVILARWRDEIDDPEVGAFVAVDDEDCLVGFAATRGNELFHFGTALRLWGSGAAAELHDFTVQQLQDNAPVCAEYFFLRVFEENRRARHFYEKLGWTETDIRTQTSFPPHPTLVEYRLFRMSL